HTSSPCGPTSGSTRAMSMISWREQWAKHVPSCAALQRLWDCAPSFFLTCGRRYVNKSIKINFNYSLSSISISSTSHHSPPHLQTCPVIVVGDLNDALGSTTTEIITGTPPWRSLPVRKRQDVW